MSVDTSNATATAGVDASRVRHRLAARQLLGIRRTDGWRLPAWQFGADGRVLPGFSREFRATLDELTGPDVTLEYAHEEIPLEAPLDAPVMERMTRALLAEDPGSVVVPYCMSGGTDAKQFSRLGMTCYGFTPLVLPEGYDYYAMFHGTDERIPLSALEASVRIMDRFLATAQIPDDATSLRLTVFHHGARQSPILPRRDKVGELFQPL